MSDDARTILVTGASSDIGIAVCRCYLADGHRVVAHYRTARPEFDAVCTNSERVERLQCDFADTAALEQVIERRRELFDSTDVLICLAACLPRLSFEEAGAEQIMAAVRVNALPSLMLMRAVVPGMVARGWGRIVIASSIGVKFGGGSHSFAYALSKHLTEFIPNACREWAAHGVLTNVIRVGVTRTRIHADLSAQRLAERISMIPMSRAASREEIARTLHWFGSEQNTYITGQVVAAAGGE